MRLRHMRFAYSAVLLAFIFSGCDHKQPTAPSLEAASTAGSGSAPAAPSSTNAVAVSDSRIDVSWQDNSSNETGFEVHRSTTGASGSFALLIGVGANVKAYSNTGLASSTQYCYKVRAFRITGSNTSYSAFSAAACATTLPPPAPAAPSGTDAKPSASTVVDVSWVDNSTNESGFRVERSLDAGSTWTNAGTVGSDVASAECVAADCPTSCNGNLDCGNLQGFMCGPDQLCVPYCFDGVKDGDESDVDCGGDACAARCTTGQTCSVHADCASGFCDYGSGYGICR